MDNSECKLPFGAIELLSMVRSVLDAMVSGGASETVIDRLRSHLEQQIEEFLISEVRRGEHNERCFHYGLSGLAISRNVHFSHPHWIEILYFAAEDGYVEAQVELARLARSNHLFPHGMREEQLYRWYESPEAKEFNLRQREIWTVKAAESNSPDAQYWLGTELLEKNEINEASYWLRKAARQSHPDAAFELARILESDRPLSLDKFQQEEIFKSFLIAAEGGIDEAILEVARRLEEGIGVQADQEAAVYWYLKVDDNFLGGEAHFQAAQLILRISTASDRQERADALMEKAAKLGHIKSSLYMSNKLTSKYGPWDNPYLNTDFEMAINWYESVSDSDEADTADKIEANLALAEIYQSGQILNASVYYCEAYLLNEHARLERALDFYESALALDEKGEFGVMKNHGDEIRVLRQKLGED
jgi:TPR repeat protein